MQTPQITQSEDLKDKTNFIWETAKKSLSDLNKRSISVEQAKASASLLKQANNILAFQLDAAKFMANNEAAVKTLQDVGL
jgi:hypothetical protein